MTQNDRLSVGRRLSETSGLGRSGLLEPGGHQPPITLWVPGELLTDQPTLVVAELAKRGIKASIDPNACGGVYRVTVDQQTEVCGPQLAAYVNELLGNDGFAGLNHVLTLAQVPRIGPGTDPEPATEEEAAWKGPSVALDGWGVVVIDTGRFWDRSDDSAPELLRQSDDEWELVDHDGGGVVDFAGTGHGGFIAGIIDRMLGVEPIVRDVATRDYENWTFAITEDDILAEVERALTDPAVKVINLSLGTYERGTELVALRETARRWVERRNDVVFVCAAGNDETDEPWYPAAFAVDEDLRDQFVSVGALDCSPVQARAEEKAAFSNHGKWVKAWAPGVDHASDYPDGVEFVYGPDQDDPNSPRASFDGFAKWSGTSFAAPYVAAELIRCAVAWDSSPLDAWRKLLKKNQGEVRFPLDEPCGNGTPDAAD